MELFICSVFHVSEVAPNIPEWILNPTAKTQVHCENSGAPRNRPRPRRDVSPRPVLISHSPSACPLQSRCNKVSNDGEILMLLTVSLHLKC